MTVPERYGESVLSPDWHAERERLVAMAEVAHQDLWQRAGLGIVTVASSDEMAGKTLSSVLHEIERIEPGLVTQSQVDYLR